MATRREPEPPSGDDISRRQRLWRRATGAETTSSRSTVGDSPAATEQERFIAEALGELGDMDVREVMTPRVDVVALDIPVKADDIAQAVRESGHSCFPVIDGDVDNLVGVLFVNDFFRTGRRNGGSGMEEPGTLDISRRIRQPFVVPETLGVLEALAEMRRQRRAFAVVVDEYGGLAGVITVKDLLEPLVGELHDEFDADDEPEFLRVDARRWLIDGRASVDDVRDRLGVVLADGDYVTLGGYLFDAFGHIPTEGEELEVGGWQLKVVDMDRRRIAKVVAKSTEPPDETGRPNRPTGSESNAAIDWIPVRSESAADSGPATASR